MSGHRLSRSFSGDQRVSRQEAWPLWTKAFCADNPSVGAPSRVTFPGEGVAVSSFANGDVDLAYSASGYDETVGLASGVTQPRQMVAVPVALGAATLAVGGDSTQPPGEKVPYTGVKLTADEVAALMGGGFPWLTRTDQQFAASITARNPQLQGILVYAGITGPTPLASTRMSTSPSPVRGRSASSSLITSGDPKRWIRLAFMVRLTCPLL